MELRVHNGTILVVWFILTWAVIGGCFSALSAANTVANILGVFGIILWIALSFKVGKRMLNLNKKKRNE